MLKYTDKPSEFTFISMFCFFFGYSAPPNPSVAVCVMIGNYSLLECYIECGTLYIKCMHYADCPPTPNEAASTSSNHTNGSLFSVLIVGNVHKLSPCCPGSQLSSLRIFVVIHGSPRQILG